MQVTQNSLLILVGKGSVMKKVSLSILISFVISLGLSAAEGWETNFEAAKKKAAAENKSLLVDFTGSDWCGWCIRLVDEVFSKDEFKKYAADKFVLVELDFPQKKEQSAELKKQNQELQRKYSVQGFPTILLMDAKGRPFAKTGYQAGGPSAYSKHLDGLLVTKTKIDSALSEAEKSAGVEKAAKLVMALANLSEDVIPHYIDVMEEIYKLDPKDTTGFKKTQGVKASLKKLQGSVAGLAGQGKVDEALKSVDDFISVNSLSGENKQKALMAKLNCFNPQNKADLDKADKLMDEVIAISKTSPTANQAAAIKGRITQMKAQAK